MVHAPRRTRRDVPSLSAAGAVRLRAARSNTPAWVAEGAMTQSGLFAHLAARFGAYPDVLAAEALAYLLTTSPAMRAAVVEVCAIAAPGLAGATDGLRFRATPPRADGQAPTLLGADAEDVTRFVVDPRFWSPLTEDQPVHLLRQLAMDRSGALLVLAPTQRFTSLWAELRRRCRLANLPVHGDHAIGDPIRWTRVGARQIMILASWSALLAAARSRLAVAGDRQAMSDVDQLAALCGQIDADPFAPLTIAELAGGSARRLAQLVQLVEDLARACEASGLGAVVDEGWADPGSLGHRLRLGTTMLGVSLSVPR